MGRSPAAPAARLFPRDNCATALPSQTARGGGQGKFLRSGNNDLPPASDPPPPRATLVHNGCFGSSRQVHRKRLGRIRCGISSSLLFWPKIWWMFWLVIQCSGWVLISRDGSVKILGPIDIDPQYKMLARVGFMVNNTRHWSIGLTEDDGLSFSSRDAELMLLDQSGELVWNVTSMTVTGSLAVENDVSIDGELGATTKTRVGSTLSAADLTMLGSALTVLDYAHSGSTLSLRGFAQLGSFASVFGTPQKHAMKKNGWRRERGLFCCATRGPVSVCTTGRLESNTAAPS
eukprot:GEMP01052165.1.p1 GENE.GEMP01052165.1~~GEMP01052165.1.p1  ORF type:complete len:318 (+),score=30.66 GEMP01052165.1:88-954(+)